MYPHSVMFHHFHNDFHPKSQGSINKNQLEEILDFLQNNFNLIGADLFSRKIAESSLENNDVVLSFDDALKCQFDIAVPVLEKRKISAFFFIYSSPFKGNPDMLEVYRLFRNNYYKNVNFFYDDFFEKAKIYKDNYNILYRSFLKTDFLKKYKFYSLEDRWFRFLRDRVLGYSLYTKIMESLMREKKFIKENFYEKLWMNDNDLKALHNSGHILGLHSYLHPTLIEDKSYNDQKNEYVKNLIHLESLLGKNKIFSMAHPCGSYNSDTLRILRKLNIKIGFRSNMERVKKLSNLEIPRQDHTTILNTIKKFE